MSARPLTALTWEHPRGYGPPGALDALDRDGTHAFALPDRMRWERQPLEGFESTDLATLSDRYDALIIDHPHIADAVRDGAIVPLSSIFDGGTLRRLAGSFAGRSYESYSYADEQWALPVDAATQVMATRPDTPTLDTWSGVASFASHGEVLLCVAGPHALSTLISVLVSRSVEVAARVEFAPRDELVESLEFLRELRARSVDGLDHLNPIQALAHMASAPSVAVIPLVYGYVNFTGEGLRFREAPSWTVDGRRGAVLGGTGIAVTPRGRTNPAVRDHVRRMVDPTIQSTVVPRAGGQPSARIAWEDALVDAAAEGFYSGTRQTLEQSWVRPRMLGWLPFYDTASATARAAIVGDLPVEDAAVSIRAAYRDLIRNTTR